MSINSNNIDKWLFDYYEGNLSPEDIRKLEQYLKKNPQYYEDADAWKNSFVEEPVPAFSSAFLVKPTEPARNRKKLVYATLLLFLLGSSVALYYILPSSENGNLPENNHSAHRTVNQHRDNAHQTVATGEVKSNENNNNNSNRHTSEENYTTGNLSFSPDIQKLQQLVTTRPSVTVSPINTPVAVNQHYAPAPGNGYTAAERYRTQHHTPTGTLPEQTVTGISEGTNNGGANEENQVIAGTSRSEHENLTGRHVITPTAISDPQLTEVNITLLNSGYAEDINLTLEKDAENNQNKNEIAGNKEAKANVPENNSNDHKERTSELNPDALLAKTKKEEEQNNIADAGKNDKTDIPIPRGFGFTNRRQVTLLQGINSEFEHNASFISQHYLVDAYTGARFVNASPVEQGGGAIIGFSQYFRKTRTTVNAFGYADKTGYIGQAGITVQAATQFKLDRYQSIVPSFSVSTTRYDFEQVHSRAYMPASYREIPSYSTGLLTGNPVYYGFKNTTKVNLSAGVLYHHKKFFAGISINGLIQPKFKYEMYDRTGTVVEHATVNLLLGTDFVSKKYPELSLSPQLAIAVRDMEADFTGGAILRYQTWGIGAGISSTGALNTYAGYTHRTFGLQYRFIYDKLEAPFKRVSGHYLTAHFNLMRFIKKQKPILDSEK